MLVKPKYLIVLLRFLNFLISGILFSKCQYIQDIDSMTILGRERKRDERLSCVWESWAKVISRMCQYETVVHVFLSLLDDVLAWGFKTLLEDYSAQSMVLSAERKELTDIHMCVFYVSCSRIRCTSKAVERRDNEIHHRGAVQRDYSTGDRYRWSFDKI